ncbi:maleylpyruvate isomerase family mycothiol-dependent enzyme [Mycobacterium sp. D16Q16]|uniref:maleylpyruvate isomerase family mycothiol-dependent enzyme n=1 Tax=Mycobacterium sp. D16Q16 TaxID=1855659 RepID=UPI001116CDA9|nr:maleylpyruvate isomerase family mycothiol-dependent enzyme [Mycobacterium sp. D16Q16]
MDTDEIWQLIDAERVTLADQLAQISAQDWDRPSLCGEWRVRDVVGHILFASEFSLPRTLVDVIRARGDLNRFIAATGVREGSVPPADLLALVRASVGSRRKPPGVQPIDRLMDHLVHGQDIAIPLGWQQGMPVGAARLAAARVWERDRLFGARTRFAEHRLIATDTDWSAGTGAAVIEGPVSALLLLMTGRGDAVRDQLSGEGVSFLPPS